jgi:hypothetical protein
MSKEDKKLDRKRNELISRNKSMEIKKIKERRNTR